MSETVGVAKVVLEGDTAGFETSVNKARESVKGVARETKKVGEEGTKAFNESTKAAERFAASVKRQADAIGKTKSQLMEAKAAALGLGTSLDPYIRKLREAEQAQTQLNSATSSFAKASAAAFTTVAVTALVAGIKNAIDVADGLNDLSQKMGVSVKSLAEFKLAADQSGTSLESIAAGSRKLGKAMTENAGAFKQAGVSTKDVKSAMYDLADIFAGMEDGVEKTQLAVKLFGKAGMEMIPMLNAGSAGLADMAKKAEDYANVMEKIAPAADAFNDAMAEFSLAGMTGFAKLAEAILPTITSIVEELTKASKETDLWASAGAGLKNVIQTVAVLAMELSYVFTGIADEVSIIGAKLSAISRLDFTTLKLLGETFDKMGAAKLAEHQAGIDRIMNPPPLATRETKVIDPAAAARAKALADAIKDAKNEAAKADDAFKKLNATIEEKVSLIEAELAGEEKLTEAQKIARKLNIDILNGNVKLSASQQKTLAESIERLDVVERLAIAEKKRLKVIEEVKKAEAESLKTMIASTDALAEKVKQAEEENQKIGLTQEQLNDLILSRQDDAIAIKKQELATAKKNSTSAAEIELLEDQVIAMERLRDVTASSQIKTAAKEAATEASKAWEKFSSDIESSLTDALMRSFESGEDFGKAFIKNLQNTLKTAVLKLAIQAVVSPITGQGGILSSLTGTASNASSASSLGSLFGQAGSSIFNGLSNGVSIGNILSSASGIGTAGTGMYGAFATSALGQTLGLSSVVPGLMGPTLSGAALGSATAGGATLSALGSALPYVGVALAALSLLGGKIGKGGTPHEGGAAWSDSVTDVTGTSAASAMAFFDAKTSLRASQFYKNPEIAKTLAPVAGAFADTLNTILNKYGKGDAKVGLAFSADNEDKSRGLAQVMDAEGNYIYGKYAKYSKDTQKGMEQFVGTLSTVLITSLQRSSLGGEVGAYLDKFTGTITEATSNQVAAALTTDWIEPFLKQLDAVGMTFEEVTAEIIKFSEVATLKPVFDALSIDIYEFGNVIADAFGGTQNAGTAMSNYYSLFYTQSEQIDAAVNSLSAAFEDLGLAVPDSNQAFRELIEGIDLTSDAGVQLYASLINLAPAFAQISAAADAAMNQMIAAATQNRSGLLGNYASSSDKLDMAKEAILKSNPLINFDELTAMGSTGLRKYVYDYVKALDPLKDSEALQAMQDVSWAVDIFVDSLVSAENAAAATAQTTANAAIAAQNAAQQTADAQAEAAARVREAWQQAADDIYRTIKELRQTLLGDKSFATAQKEFAIATTKARAGDQEAANMLPELARTVSDLGKGVAGSRTEEMLINAKLASSLAGTLEALKKFGIEIPSYSVGTEYVPYDMVAKVHKGERIIPADANFMDTGSNVIDITPLLDEMQGLREEVRAVAYSTGKSARLLDRVMPDGDAIQTREAA